MMFPTSYRRIYSLRLVLCLLGMMILFVACSAGNTIGSVPTATPTPVPTATPAPTVTPTPFATLFLYISCGDVKQNGYGVDVEHGKVCASTLPGATLQIKVSYCNGKADPSNVLQGSVVADQNGVYRWNWTPQPDCKGQPIWSYNATVTARIGDQFKTEMVSAMA